MIKVLCLGGINASNATFKQALNAGMQVEWVTAEDVQ